VEDPTVRQVALRLMQSIDRAIELCSQTLSFGQADEAAPDQVAFVLYNLVDDVPAFAGLPSDGIATRCNDSYAEIVVTAA